MDVPRHCLLLAALGFAASGGMAHAQPTSRSDALLPAAVRVDVLAPPGLSRPSFTSPKRVGPSPQGSGTPQWTRDGLVSFVPWRFAGLAAIAKPGLPTYDLSTDAWFASANGALVRLDRDGRLPVIADNIQGIDVDVRASCGLAVSREPNDTIVLHSWGSGATLHQVVLRGTGFFRPRFSPDGSHIVVSESRAEGGHFWVISLDGTATDVAQGYTPSWLADGRHVVFVRVHHDGSQILDSELWSADIQSREERIVARPGVPLIDPVVSPDGTLVAFLHGRSREVQVASFATPWTRENEVTP